jgi:hypothetical protein
MAETLFRGPSVAIGSLMDGRVEPLDGPTIDYQGEMIANPALSPANKDGTAPGAIKGWHSVPYIVTTDTIPSSNSTTTVAAAQTPSTTAGVALNLTTAVLGTAAGVPVWTPGIPIIPVGTSVATTVSAIDFGFATGTTVANSSTVIVNDNTLFAAGQWIVIGGAGSAGATNVALFAQVQSLSTNANSAIITISPVAATALSHAPIGQGNLYSQFLPPATQFGPAAASANAADPYKVAGFALPFNPLEGSARALSITAASIGSGTGTFLVSGYDMYFNAMSELLSPSGTTTVNGKKAFKYVSSIKSVVAATTVTPAQINVGISDIFGFHIRSDKWEYADYRFAGSTVLNNSGWTKALGTSSSTTTADVRGTLNASTAFAVPTDGARRLIMGVTVPVYSIVSATPLNTAPILGTAQV